MNDDKIETMLKEYGKRAKKTDYPLSERVLAKWKEEKLSIGKDEKGLLEFTFLFRGSTCSNGGMELPAELILTLKERTRRLTAESIRVFFPDMNAVGEMCAYKSAGSEFLNALQKNLDNFSGRVLEKVISEKLPLNAAGCFCRREMVNQKILWLFSTVHYALITSLGPD